jgi:hypothetical protein
MTFPQLMLAPVTKKILRRTVVNELADGHLDLFTDANAAAIQWEIGAGGMTAAEFESVRALFASVSGRWGSFTFLDPAGNLLAQSENFGVSPWVNGLSLTTGVTDPFGTTRATHAVNTSGVAAQSIAQTLAVPSMYQYALSVWARSGAVTLSIGTSTRRFVVGSTWTRVSMSGSGTVFAVGLDAGASADLFGMQVDAQIAASDYKKTGVLGGVFPKTRFADDTLTVTARGTDVYDAVIRIVNTEN